MKTKLVKISDLEQIFWENGHYVDKDRNIISVEPIGIPAVFGSASSVGIEGIYGNRKQPHATKKTLSEHLNSEQDQTYREARFYAMGVSNSGHSGWYHPVSFFKKR